LYLNIRRGALLCHETAMALPFHAAAMLFFRGVDSGGCV